VIHSACRGAQRQEDESIVNIPVPFWAPSSTITEEERGMLDWLAKHDKLFVFLRQHRMALFDEDFQSELAGMYRGTGEGKRPVPPAFVCMVLILQAHTGASDSDAIGNTMYDRRWQLVLGLLGSTRPALAQGTLHNFRQKLIKHDMDLRLLERSVELAMKTQGFDRKHLPKTLRLAIDSRPIEGAGRVEDTINLLGNATLMLLRTAAHKLGMKPDDVAKAAGAPIFLAPSIKTGLDIDWTNPNDKAGAIGKLLQQIDAIEVWIRGKFGRNADESPLKERFDLIAKLKDQNIDPNPPGGGKPILREGVAENRRVSIHESEMRHGRKSKTKRFNGYKQHIVNDLDTELILACAMTPANRPEGEGAVALKKDLQQSMFTSHIREVFVDRAYVNTEFVETAEAEGARVYCKPRNPANGDLFTKSDFTLNFRLRTITCPAGNSEKFTTGQSVEFNASTCGRCPQRSRCTKAANDVGRTVHIAKDERRQHRFRKLVKSATGRAIVRKRVGVEHRLAHLAMKQGPRARYRGERMNLFDLRRFASLLNLQVIQRSVAVAA
jgi:hypothetical protein